MYCSSRGLDFKNCLYCRQMNKIYNKLDFKGTMFLRIQKLINNSKVCSGDIILQ